MYICVYNGLGGTNVLMKYRFWLSEMCLDVSSGEADYTEYFIFFSNWHMWGFGYTVKKM